MVTRRRLARVLVPLVVVVTASRQLPDEFSIALIPDTQNYTDISPQLNYDQMYFLATRRDSLQLAFAIHLGDLTDSNLDEWYQWFVASRAHSILDSARVPYSVIPGNHDMPELGDDSTLSRDLSTYNLFFGPARFTSGNRESWNGFGGFMAEAPENKYWLFERSGLRFAVIGLELAPRKDAVCWANELARRYADRRIIITTHCYQTVGGGHQSNCAVRYGLVGSGGDVLFNELVRLHSNILLVLSGHINEAAHRARARTIAGQRDTVHEIITDYQNERDIWNRKSGNGWLRIMRFVPQRDSVYVVPHSVGMWTRFRETGRYSASPRSVDHRFAFATDLHGPPAQRHSSDAGEFHDRTVNPRSRGQQRDPSVAANSDSTFVVAWTDDPGEGRQAIHARAFDAQGCERFRMTPVSRRQSTMQRHPAVAVNNAGSIVVVWEDANENGRTDIYARGFAADGSVLFDDLPVATGTATQSHPNVSMEASGAFVVTWQENAGDASEYEVRARRFGPTGQPGPLVTVNAVSSGQQRRPDIGMTPAGDYVVVWEDDRDGNGFYQIKGRGYRADGSTWFAEQTINSAADGQQLRPAVGVSSSGRVVVVWSDDRNRNSAYQIRARRLTQTGSPLGPDLLVNTASQGQQIQPDVAAGADGSFVVVWADDRNQNETYQIRRRSYNLAGVPEQSDDVVNFNPAGQQLTPSVAVHSGSGRPVVVWEDDSNANQSFEILARGLPGIYRIPRFVIARHLHLRNP